MAKVPELRAYTKIPKEVSFRTEDLQPEGLFLHGHQSTGLWLDYAGSKLQIQGFEMPADPDVLEDFGRKVGQLAAEMRARRHRVR